MSRKSIIPILDQCEQMIRSGLSHVARPILVRQMNLSRSVSAAEKIRLGHLLRRTGCFNECVKVLHSLARDERPSDNRDLAQIEYATALTFLGLTAEAENIFLSLDKIKYPHVYAQMSTLNTINWDYESSVKNLETYFKNTFSTHRTTNTNDEYFNLIAEINLNISYAFAAPEKINLNRIYEIQKIIEKNNYKLLEAVTTQIIGRYLTMQKQFSTAETVFASGLKTLRGQKTFDYLYLKKWQLINALEKEKQSNLRNLKKIIMDFMQLKKTALILKDHETTRECDYYISLYTKNKQLHTYCYFGSPYSHYLNKFDHNLINDHTIFKFNDNKMTYETVKHSDSNLISNDQYEFGKSHIKSKNSVIINLSKLSSYFVSKNCKKLKSEKILSSLLNSLTNDFYRPKTIHRLFKDVFSDRYWNPESSPNQIRQIVFRFREWSKENNAEFDLIHKSNHYYLALHNQSAVFLKNKSHDEKYFLNSLSNDDTVVLKNNHKEFSFTDFMKSTGLSKRTAERKIAELKQQGKIKKIGTTRATQYVWIKP